MNNIAIIGGGAAGMMAAATIDKKNSSLILIERNPGLGRKVIISGGGRCNVTTGVEDLKEVLKKYPRGAKFFRTPLYNFPPQKMMEWLEAQGVPLKTEADLRVFPVSNKGADVVGAFESAMEGVDIRFRTKADKIEKKGRKFIITLDDGEKLEVDKVIITTGGQAYQQTGSIGDGYQFAQDLGHTITELAPSLSAFMLKEDWVKAHPGLSFESVRLKLVGEGKYEFTGPILFTHKGVSGPGVFALSSLAAYETLDARHEVQLLVDFFPDETYDEITARLNKELQATPKKSPQNVVGMFVYKSLAKTICDNLGISAKKNNELSKKEINKVVEALKNTQLTIVGRTPGDEFVTAGGIVLSEIDPKTMESKVCPGLYFAGEILDIDGFTGGYSLQIAWATGRLAGESVA
jgi:hypothetical protein